ncbi:MAG: hypothetical protein ACXVFQ_17885 [Solirubrobacteraceae bacterium]
MSWVDHVDTYERQTEVGATLKEAMEGRLVLDGTLNNRVAAMGRELHAFEHGP